MLEKFSKVKIGSNRSFGFVFFIVFFIVAFWNFRGEFSQIRTIPLYISLVFLILGLINSKLLTPLNKLWFKFGMLLGAIIAPFVMMLVFFIVVTPIGLIMKLMGKDLLNKKINKNVKSYWISRKDPMGTMKNQF